MQTTTLRKHQRRLERQLLHPPTTDPVRRLHRQLKKRGPREQRPHPTPRDPPATAEPAPTTAPSTPDVTARPTAPQRPATDDHPRPAPPTTTSAAPAGGQPVAVALEGIGRQIHLTRAASGEERRASRPNPRGVHPAQCGYRRLLLTRPLRENAMNSPVLDARFTHRGEHTGRTQLHETVHPASRQCRIPSAKRTASRT